jgi:hypothetical protein
MAAMSLVANFAEPDDKPEPTEEGDPLVLYGVSVEVGGCLGFACPAPSDACDTCKFFGARKKIGDPPDESLLQSRHHGRLDLYTAAPAARGYGARAELHVRVKF